MAESGSDDREADFLRLTAQAPNGSNSDIAVYLDYGSMEQNGSDSSSWNIGADYIAYFNGIGGRSARLTPYLGAGVGYLDDERPIRLGEDGFTWVCYWDQKFNSPIHYPFIWEVDFLVYGQNLEKMNLPLMQL